jgi:hypothetical protein
LTVSRARVFSDGWVGWAGGYLRARLPVASVLLPLTLAFLCSHALNSGGAARVDLNWALFRGLATFLLLFVQLRLIDDLDDLEADLRALRASAPPPPPRIRARLRAALVVVFSLLLTLNAAHGATLAIAVVAATLLSYAGPFGIKRHLPARPPVLVLAFVVFEGAPACFFAYVSLNAGAGASPGAGTAIAVPCLAAFWLAYEYWKFSRKAHLPASHPYLLSRRGVRRALTALMVVAAAANAALASRAGFGTVAMAYVVAVPLGLCAWLNRRWTPAASGAGSPPLWSGMAYMFLLDAGIGLELLARVR